MYGNCWLKSSKIHPFLSLLTFLLLSKKSKIPKWQSETVTRRRTDSKMTKRKKDVSAPLVAPIVLQTL